MTAGFANQQRTAVQKLCCAACRFLLSSFVASALSFGLTRKSDEHTAVYAIAGFKSRRRSGCVHVDLYFDILYPFFSRGASCDGGNR